MKKKIKKCIIKIIHTVIYILLRCTWFPPVKVYTKKILPIQEQYNKKLIGEYGKRESKGAYHLTIIIPVYNAKETLNYCLDSILNQKTNYNYLVIAVNDGSTDGTDVILKQYEEKYNNLLVITQENKGISEARNTGISYVTREYVGFIDNDDYVTENYVELLLNNAYETGADVVRCNHYEFHTDKGEYTRVGIEHTDTIIKGGLKDRILEFNGYPWAGIYKLTLWDNIGFPKNYWCEDMIIRMILYRRSQVFSFINDRLYYHCIHQSNTTKSRKSADIQCLDHFFLIGKLCKLSKDIGLKEDYELRINCLYEYSVVLWLRTRKLDKDLRKEVFLEACNAIEQLIKNQKELTKEHQLIVTIMKKREYIRWQLYSIYKMLEVKYEI